MLQKIYLFFTLLLLPAVASASVIRWLVDPKYDHIEYYSEDVFKAWSGDKIQLIDFKGNEILPYVVDSVTQYSEGYALALVHSGREFRICGILSENDHAFKRIEEEWYATRYSYCSEGCIVVSNAEGKKGYIDYRGNLVINFLYHGARPFKKGWASVVPAPKEATYIDRNGSTLFVPELSNSQITEASSFNDEGEALLCSFSKLYIVDTSGKTRKYKLGRGKKTPIRPYDYAYDENAANYVAKHNNSPVFDGNFVPFAEEGLYGFKTIGEETAVFAQFNEVGFVSNSCFIAKKDGVYGVVVMEMGDFQASILEKDAFAVIGNNSREIPCSISVPDGMVSNCEIFFDNGDGVKRPVKLKKGVYRFKPYCSPESKNCHIVSEVYHNGLLQLRYEKDLDVINIHVGTPTGKGFADENDIQKVRSKITNASDIPVDITVVFSATLKAGSKNSITSKQETRKHLDPNESVDCVLVFNVLEEEQVVVSVSVLKDKTNCGRSEATVSLKPFY